MNRFFQDYVDLTALCISFFIPMLLTLLVKRRTGRQTRAIGVYFLFFGPVGILTFMFFHLLENSYRAVEGAVAGTFKYNFHFYSLVLLGLVLSAIATFLIRACWQKSIGKEYGNRYIFLYMGLTALVCLPLFPITPISNVPVFCCLLSLPGVFWGRRKESVDEL